MDSDGAPTSPTESFDRQSSFNPDMQINEMTDDPPAIQSINENPMDQEDVPPSADDDLNQDESSPPTATDFPPPPDSLTSDEPVNVEDDVTSTAEAEDDIGKDIPPAEDHDPSEGETTTASVAAATADGLSNDSPEPPQMEVVTTPAEDSDIEMRTVNGEDVEDGGPMNGGNHPAVITAHRETVKKRYVQREPVYVEEKNRNNPLCFLCMCMIILLSIGALLAAVIWISMLVPESGTIQEAVIADNRLISADVSLTMQGTFDDSLLNSSSTRYKQLEGNVIEDIEEAMMKSTFRTSFFGTIVRGFRSGSIIVHTSLFFTTPSNDLINRVEDDLEGQLAANLPNNVTVMDVQNVQVISRDDTKQPIQRVDSSGTVTGSPGRVTEESNSPGVIIQSTSTESESETVTDVVTDFVTELIEVN